MSIRKRNEYLEGEDSEGLSDHGYDSEAAEESRGAIAGRAPKRRRLSVDSDDEPGDSDREAAQEDCAGRTGLMSLGLVDDDVDASEHEGSGIPLAVPTTSSKAFKQVEAARKVARRSGVVYISRVPPFMKPQTLKHFLAPHATKGLGRIFLTPEDHVAHSRRVKSGGNKKKSFTDGWVEFVSKREAKIAAAALNGNIIGGKKGNFYHDDLWSMKYLKGFKWSHLTEQIANENAERQARMREEVRKTKKENKAFMEDIERGKMLDGMESKRRTKQASGGNEEDSVTQPVRRGKPQVFTQKAARKPEDGQKLSEQATSIQRLIF